jgi:hypothetical protein
MGRLKLYWSIDMTIKSDDETIAKLNCITKEILCGNYRVLSIEKTEVFDKFNYASGKSVDIQSDIKINIHIRRMA